MITAGADGCSAGWVCAIRDAPDTLRLAVIPDFRALLASLPGAMIAVDMPIGLPDEGARDCDRLARQRLGPRRASVFPAAIRPCLTAKTHAEASATRRLLETRGMSIQAWNIVPKIREVDRALSPMMQDRVFEAHPELAFAAMNREVDRALSPMMQDRVFEAHPELAFAAMNRGNPCPCSKKTLAGKEARQAMLAANLPLASTLLKGRRPPGVAADDLLDAMAVLWTADRRVAGTAERLPTDPARDRRGLRMEIWY